jgi:outer membrane protein assembly factor BamB
MAELGYLRYSPGILLQFFQQPILHRLMNATFISIPAHAKAWSAVISCAVFWMTAGYSRATDPLPQNEGKPVVSQKNRKSNRSQPADFANQWHQWRGPDANGVSRTARPPVSWSEERNIKWKVAIEGSGSASPIIWNNKVFLLTATDTGEVDPSRPRPEDQPERVFGIKHPNTFYKLVVLCLNRTNGKVLWRREARKYVPHEGHHRDNDFASAAPVTDGQRLYCWFGSGGFYCYDLEGKQLWQRDLGRASVGASLGEGCPPVVFEGKIAVVRDHSRKSSVEVLDAKTGKTLWKKERDEPNAWATPSIVKRNKTVQLITAASRFVRSYDLGTGELIWQCSGLTGNVIPCPIVEGDMVFCMSGYEGYSLLALPLAEKGDFSEAGKVIWSKNRGTPYVPSPVLYDGLLYYTQSNQAILSVVQSKDGKEVFARRRLPGLKDLYASPVGAEGKVYFTGRDGTTVVIARSDEFKVLSTNRLQDRIDSSAALAGRQLFLRGQRFLYCIEENQ